MNSKNKAYLPAKQIAHAKNSVKDKHIIPLLELRKGAGQGSLAADKGL